MFEYLIMAIFAGFIGSIMGLGGGVIMVPTLTSIFNIPIHKAIALSIMGVVATSVSGSSKYFERKLTNIRLAMYLETATTVGALSGALLALIMREGSLYLIFAVFAFYVCIAQLHSIRNEEKERVVIYEAHVRRVTNKGFFNFSGEYYDEYKETNVKYEVCGYLKGWLISMFAGVGSGLLGIGGGFIKVSAINIFMKVPLKVAIATSKFMIGVTAATSAVLYYVCGVVDLGLVAPIVVGTTIGSYIGTLVMNRLKSRWLALAFAMLVAYLGLNMLFKGLRIIGVMI
ncbi:permease [Candidatus Bathyarchaeota archaeon ex4484_205]|nr:MAG: permease [Candidatus Bathyarchaeota archaeon ex4484_205]